MDQPQGSNPSFAEQLRNEARRVLADPIFQRSPVQSRLLEYLVERAADGGSQPTQYEIAVDALGKDPDFDLANDSYPRVQISRLRANLDAYYSRNQPGAGRRILLTTGQYRLNLGKPEERSDPLIGSVGEESVSADMVNSQPVGKRNESADKTGRTSSKVIPALVAVIGLLSAAVAIMFVLQLDAGESEPITEPSVLLEADLTPMEGMPSRVVAVLESALRQAEIQLAYSMVSRSHVPSSPGEPDYRLRVEIVPGNGQIYEAVLMLLANNGERIYSDRIELDPDNISKFTTDFAAALVFATSPSGAIANHVFEQIGDVPGSAYACFIKIEGQRATGANTTALVDQCIQNFPDGNYSPYLYARRAFSYYQRQRLAGEPILKSGRGWSDVTRALDGDRFNAFANFTAAKVELANNNCAGAVGHLERAFENATSYPALIAALEAEANSCAVYRRDDRLTTEQLRDLVANNPSPDALLHVYLLMAALSSGDRDTASLLPSRPQSAASLGKEEETIYLLDTSLSDPQFARENEDQIRSNIGIFIWSDAGVDQIMRNLTGPLDTNGRGARNGFAELTGR